MSSALTNLLQHLGATNTRTGVSNGDLVESIGYHLCEPPAHAKSPTALVAAVVNSPVWHPLELEICSQLRDALSSAALYKYRRLTENGGGGLFSRSTSQSMMAWVNEVEEGVRVGPLSIQAICIAGALKGLKSTQLANTSSRIVSHLQTRLVEALSLIYHPTATSNSWETDFQSKTQATEPDIICIIVSAEHLQGLSYESLRPLGLEAVIIRLLDSMHNVVAKDGVRSFLQVGKTTVFTANGENKSLKFESILINVLGSISTSPSFIAAAAISKLLTHLIGLHSGGQPVLAWSTCDYILKRIEATCTVLADDWFASPLCSLQEDMQLDSPSRDAVASVWSILKTTLFANIMITQSILSVFTYAVPPAYPSDFTDEFLPGLSARVLNIHAKLAFVISQFGGISPSSGAGFTELKRVVYTALDILTSSAAHADRFIRDCSAGLETSPDTLLPRTQYPRLAFTLACAEQLMPVLPEQLIREHLIPLCIPYLGSSNPRDLFECAHSVMLSIFATSSPQREQMNAGGGWPKLARRMVPFYLDSLLENSRDGCLNTEQLRLAFATLTRAAGELSSAASQSSVLPPNSLTWYIVDSLQQSIAPFTEEDARCQRLRLALVSTISGLDRVMLQHTLPIVSSIIEELPTGGSERKELIDALYGVMLNEVADAHKQFVMDWWHVHRGRWEVESNHVAAQL